MAATRLDSDERRKAIVAAAVPLFARKGFAGTTTKELAEAARISEALLFRHFPSKKQLYDEILALGCEGDPALECLAALEPSTTTLVRMIHFMVRYFCSAGASIGANSTRACVSSSTAFSRTAIMRASCSTIFCAGSSAFCRIARRQPGRRVTSGVDPSVAANQLLVQPPCRRNGGVRPPAGPGFDRLSGNARGTGGRGELVHPARYRDERRGDR